MKEIYKNEGIFYEHKMEKVKLENGDEIIHKQERPTKLWWELKEAVKGKKVRIIVYEIGE